VAPFAARLGADRLLGTRLVLDAEDRIVGALHGRNCRGAEKVSRLEEAFGPGLRLAAAYGDSAGDREMVAIAGAGGVGVFKGRPAGG
jgi:phosphatidylglycerophosphatase C